MQTYVEHEKALKRYIDTNNTSEADTEKEFLVGQKRDIAAKEKELKARPDYNAIAKEGNATGNGTDLQNALNEEGGVSKLLVKTLNKGFDYNKPASENK